MDSLTTLYRYLAANFEADRQTSTDPMPAVNLLTVLVKLDIKSASLQNSAFSYDDYVRYYVSLAKNKQRLSF